MKNAVERKPSAQACRFARDLSLASEPRKQVLVSEQGGDGIDLGLDEASRGERRLASPSQQVIGGAAVVMEVRSEFGAAGTTATFPE